MGAQLHSGFALTQALRCADWSGGKDPVYSGAAGSPAEAQAAATNWRECALGNRSAYAGAAGTTSTVMGYSMRTLDFRYTLWLHFDPSSLLVQWERGVYAEELYDHREDGGAGDLGKYELVNLLAPHAPAETKEAYREAAHEQRSMLVHFLHRQVTYKTQLTPGWAESAAGLVYEENKRAFAAAFLNRGTQGPTADAASGTAEKRKKLSRREEKRLKEFIKGFAGEGEGEGKGQGGSPGSVGAEGGLLDADSSRTHRGKAERRGKKGKAHVP